MAMIQTLHHTAMSHSGSPQSIWPLKNSPPFSFLDIQGSSHPSTSTLGEEATHFPTSFFLDTTIQTGGPLCLRCRPSYLDVLECWKVFSTDVKPSDTHDKAAGRWWREVHDWLGCSSWENLLIERRSAQSPDSDYEVCWSLLVSLLTSEIPNRRLSTPSRRYLPLLHIVIPFIFSLLVLVLSLNLGIWTLLAQGVCLCSLRASLTSALDSWISSLFRWVLSMTKTIDTGGITQSITHPERTLKYYYECESRNGFLKTQKVNLNLGLAPGANEDQEPSDRRS